MKKYLNLPAAAMFCIVLTIVSCSKSADNAPANNTDTAAGAMTSGKWVISSFSQKTENNTSKFTGVVFTFSPDGTVAANDNGKIISGLWHHTPSVTYYGATSKEAMSMNMGADKPYSKLGRIWNVVSSSPSIMKLENPEIMEDEHLQFSKQYCL